MCDFLSSICRVDGAFGHKPHNSHSQMIQELGWRENDQMADFRSARFVECEWSGKGDYPGADKVARGAVNEKQRKAIDNYYGAFAKLLANPEEHSERMLFGNGIFASDDYSDIRFAILTHEKCPKRIAEKLAILPLMAMGQTIKSLHPLVSKLEGCFNIERGYKIEANALTEVAGDVKLDQGASLTANALTEVAGDVYLEQGASLTANALTEVAGDVYLDQGASLTANALTKAGDVYLDQGASLTANALTKAGYVKLEQGASLTANALTEVAGYVKLDQGASLTANALTEVAGDVYLDQGAKIEAPNFKRK